MPDADPTLEPRPDAPRETATTTDTTTDTAAGVVRSVEIDAGTRLLSSEATALRRAVRELSTSSPMVTLRVDRVVAFDTSGLGLLLGLHRLARANGSGLVVAGPGPRLHAALRRRGLHRVLVVDPDVPGAPAG